MLKRSVIIVLMIHLILFASSHLSAQPEKILLDHPEVFKKRARPPVAFSHIRHMEAVPSCKDCHHKYENGKNVLDEGTLQEGNKGIKCSACHGVRDRIDLKEAFHSQCISCHKNKKTGPRFCGECHIRKQKI
jgi:c(7)-type cytochrome triheme protein